MKKNRNRKIKIAKLRGETGRKDADFSCMYDLAAADCAAENAAMELERARAAFHLALIRDFMTLGEAEEIREEVETELIWADAALDLAKEEVLRTRADLAWAEIAAGRTAA